VTTSASERFEVVLATPDDRVSRNQLGIDRDCPVLAVVGTTNDMEPDLAEALFPFLVAAVRAAGRTGAVIVTGGTDSGVFHLLGLALAAAREKPAAVVGVAPGALIVDGETSPTDGRAPIDPQLTVLVRAPGDAWGDETPPLSRIVSSIAGRHPAVALLVGGGDGTRVEVIEHLLRHRPIVVLGGSGRLADSLAQGLTSSPDTDLRALVSTGDVRVVDTTRSPSELDETLRSLLAPAHASPRRDRWAVLSVLPRPRLRLEPPGPLLGPRAEDRYPALRTRIEEADRIVFPAFAALDVAARAEQNRYRWFTMLALMGGLLTTAFGALQAWLNSQPWPGVVVATVGAATSALTTVARRQGSLQTYLTARIRAERLRSLYFEHLTKPPASGDDLATTIALEAAVAQHRYGPVAL
jgi:SLOG in TRPM, prokaryote